MTTFGLTLREDHEAALRDHLLRGDGLEHAAYVLCGRAGIRRATRGIARRTRNSSPCR